MSEEDILGLILLSHRMDGHDMSKKLVIRLSKEGYKQFYAAMKGYYHNSEDIFVLMGYNVKVLAYKN